MAARRTQIYLTEEQRDRLDELMLRERKSLAQLVRDAIDAYIGSRPGDVDAVLEETFGTIPDLDIPPRKQMWGSRGATTG